MGYWNEASINAPSMALIKAYRSDLCWWRSRCSRRDRRRSWGTTKNAALTGGIIGTALRHTGQRPQALANAIGEAIGHIRPTRQRPPSPTSSVTIPWIALVCGVGRGMSSCFGTWRGMGTRQSKNDNHEPGITAGLVVVVTSAIIFHYQIGMPRERTYPASSERYLTVFL